MRARRYSPHEPTAAARLTRRPLLLVAAVMLAVAVGAAAGAAWWPLGGEEQLPAMPATAEEALRGLPEPAGEDGWRREFGERPLDKPDLAGTDQHGEPYDLRAETAGAPTLLFFGYTHCPDACPAQMAILAAALDDVDPQVREALKVVFVTVDPDRDTPERLRQWLANFDEDVIGLTGDPDEVAEAMGQLHLSEPVLDEPDEHGDYEVRHHSPFVAFHPADDRAHTMYPFGMRADQWREELPRLVAGEDLTSD